MDKDVIEFPSSTAESDTSVDFTKSDSGVVVRIKVKGITTVSIKISADSCLQLFQFLKDFKPKKPKEKKMSKKDVKEIKEHFNMTEGLYL